MKNHMRLCGEKNLDISFPFLTHLNSLIYPHVTNSILSLFSSAQLSYSCLIIYTAKSILYDAQTLYLYILYKKESATILFPNMAPQLSDPTFVAKLMAHLDACKDVCDNFGVNTILVPLWGPGDPSGKNNKIVNGFEVKSYRNPNNLSGFGTFSQGLQDGSDMKFAPDPFWDDDEEWDFSGIDEEEDGTSNSKAGDLPQIETLVPQDDDTIIDLSKKWVDRMMADLALCPFTQSAGRSGIPLGPVHYHVDRVSSMEDAYRAYWSEVCRIEQVDQNEISTTLHILPEFCMNSVELFEQWADTLTGTLEALAVEELLQLIFFHPQWIFRDGGDRSGDNPANYARRSPWPMVNILRTKQVRVAQKGIPTGLVYQQVSLVICICIQIYCYIYIISFMHISYIS